MKITMIEAKIIFDIMTEIGLNKVDFDSVIDEKGNEILSVEKGLPDSYEYLKFNINGDICFLYDIRPVVVSIVYIHLQKLKRGFFS